MGKSFNTGLLTNGIAQDSSNNIGIGGAANASYKLAVTGASLFTGAATFSSSVTANGAINARAGGYLALYDISTNTNRWDIYTNSDNSFRMNYNGAGNDEFVITSSGNVGIGTSSPSNLLSIAASTNSGSGSTYPLQSISNTLATQGDGSSTFNFAGLLVQSGNGAVQFYHSTSYASGTWEPQALLNVATNHPLIIRTNNTERMRISAAGNMSLGFAANVDDCRLYIRTADNGTTNNGLLIQNPAGSTLLKVRNDGNVGIGTSSPSTPLHIQSSASGMFTINSTDANGGYMVFQKSGSARGYIGSAYHLVAPVGSNNDLAISNDAGNIVFVTGASFTERMRITSGGGVVIGATTTGYKFEVVGGGSYTALFNQSGGNASFPTVTIQHNVTSGTIMLQQYYTGSTDVGRITSNGSTITFSGNALSDARHKENIKPIQNALEAINKIDFVTFNYKENNKQKSAGVTAQQAQTVQGISDFVIDGTDEESYKAFDYNALIGYLGAALQELSAKVTELENKLK